MSVENQFFLFTKTFLKNSLQERWNGLFTTGIKSWKKINPWDLWEDDFCKTEYRTGWTQSLEELIKHLAKLKLEKITVLGLGHNQPFVKELILSDLSSFIKKGKPYWIEGLLLTDTTVTVVPNHNGELLIFHK